MSKYIEIFSEEELASEIWKWIPSCPGYVASSLGRIGSCWKQPGPNPSIITGTIQRIVSPQLQIDSRNGHRCIRVRLCVKGKRPSRLRSRLVAEAFHGPCPTGIEVLHGPFDGTQENSIDDRPQNLRYGTHSQNLRMSLAHKKDHHLRRQLTDDQVRQIRGLRSHGMSYYRLSKTFNIHYESIRGIISGKIYADVV